MSDEAVGPALTPEEWSAMEKFAADPELPRPTSGCRNVAWVYYDGSISVEGEHGYTLGAEDGYAEALHAVAALCLYQQPFGFTREDVWTLLRRADEWEAEWNARPKGATYAIEDPHPPDALRSLAARIAALLPPETP